MVLIRGVTALGVQLQKPIDVLDLSDWQKGKLAELGLTTVGDVLNATEEKLKEAYYVGDVSCASSPVTRCFALRFLWIVERHFCKVGLDDL